MHYYIAVAGEKGSVEGRRSGRGGGGEAIDYCANTRTVWGDPNVRVLREKSDGVPGDLGYTAHGPSHTSDQLFHPGELPVLPVLPMLLPEIDVYTCEIG